MHAERDIILANSTDDTNLPCAMTAANARVASNSTSITGLCITSITVPLSGTSYKQRTCRKHSD